MHYIVQAVIKLDTLTVTSNPKTGSRIGESESTVLILFKLEQQSKTWSDAHFILDNETNLLKVNYTY